MRASGKAGQDPPLQNQAGQDPPLQNQAGQDPPLQNQAGQDPPLQEAAGTEARSTEDGPRQARPLQNDFAFFLQLRAPKFGHSGILLKWKWSLIEQAHPSLSLVWASCGLAEREMLEMLGVPFAGNPDLRPLLLDMRFAGHPLRRDFKSPPPQDYASALLADRHEAGLIFGLRQAAENRGTTRPSGSASDNTGASTSLDSPASRVLSPDAQKRSAEAMDYSAELGIGEKGLRTQDSGQPGSSATEGTAP
ncbi:NADH-quinone oxidoreductase subunit C [bacterium]|nr:NADH-quinone oxidoreductase subunit C [bacterium]